MSMLVNRTECGKEAEKQSFNPFQKTAKFTVSFLHIHYTLTLTLAHSISKTQQYTISLYIADLGRAEAWWQGRRSGQETMQKQVEQQNGRSPLSYAVRVRLVFPLADFFRDIDTRTKGSGRR